MKRIFLTATIILLFWNVKSVGAVDFNIQIEQILTKIRELQNQIFLLQDQIERIKKETIKVPGEAPQQVMPQQDNLHLKRDFPRINDFWQKQFCEKYPLSRSYCKEEKRSGGGVEA